MALTRDQIIGFAPPAMCYRFTMRNPAGKQVPCSISIAALDRLGSNRGKNSIERRNRDQLFRAFRQRIENAAERLYDSGGAEPGAIRLFVHHLDRRKTWSASRKTKAG